VVLRHSLELLRVLLPYLAWRRVSFKHAYVAALVPHMLINVTVMASVFLMESPNPYIERTWSLHRFN